MNSENTNIILNVTATTPGNPLEYQWQVDMGGGFVNVTNGAPYSGATTVALTITSIPIGYDGYIYRCKKLMKLMIELMLE